MKGNCKNIFWALILAGSFLLCRFPLFALHGMKQWPGLLVGLGCLALLAAMALKGRWLAMAAGLGYLAGFGAALLFHRQGLDPGGGRTDNFWMLWTAFYLLCLAAGGGRDFAAKGRCRK